jgi:hypothetical protein
MLNPLEAIKLVQQRHGHWSEHLRQFVVSLGKNSVIQPPKCTFFLRGGNVAGHCNMIHGCSYSLAYACLYAKDFDCTVAHECCHWYQRHAMPHSEWHGEFFLFMLRHVCGFTTAQTKHSMNDSLSRKVGKILTLQYRSGVLVHDDIRVSRKAKARRSM